MSDYLLNIALAPPGMTDLKISRLEGYEELGRSFEYTLELTSPTHSHAADDALGQPMAVHIESSDEHGRYVHGRVTSFQYLGSTHSHASYQVTLRPWSWLLSKNANCRIFQQKTAPDIVLEVFRAAGFSDFENGLTET
ncbi:MAG TPA: contractile injection system protein, VgrG/Pvc8 family, partial [Pirellulaceae bacterium]|nr:contractile injection system protein, VgrG/Pvc8 family [Pirellulaceae bacterium]